jgi:hypothetical protein
MRNRLHIFAIATLLLSACGSASDPAPESDDRRPTEHRAEFASQVPRLHSSPECVQGLAPEILATTNGRRISSGDTVDVGSVVRFNVQNDTSSHHWTVHHTDDDGASLVVVDEPLVLELSAIDTYDVRLTVEDNTCQMTEFFSLESVAPAAVEDPGVVVELFWDTPGDPSPDDTHTGDLDLHYRAEGGTWNERPLDCFAGNKGPDWGPSGRIGNPRLAASPVSPERLVHPTPDASFYDVGVEYADDRGFGPSIVTVRIWFDGALVHEENSTLEPGEFWSVARLWGENGTVISFDDET